MKKSKTLLIATYERAEKILTENRDILEAMKDALMKYETIDAKQVDDLMARREVRPPADWDNEDKSDSSKPSGGATVTDEVKESESADTSSKPKSDSPDSATPGDATS